MANTYLVRLTITEEFDIEVQADNAEEAHNKALEVDTCNETPMDSNTHVDQVILLEGEEPDDE